MTYNCNHLLTLSDQYYTLSLINKFSSLEKPDAPDIIQQGRQQANQLNAGQIFDQALASFRGFSLSYQDYFKAIHLCLGLLSAFAKYIPEIGAMIGAGATLANVVLYLLEGKKINACIAILLLFIPNLTGNLFTAGKTGVVISKGATETVKFLTLNKHILLPILGTFARFIGENSAESVFEKMIMQIQEGNIV